MDLKNVLLKIINQQSTNTNVPDISTYDNGTVEVVNTNNSSLGIVSQRTFKHENQEVIIREVITRPIKGEASSGVRDRNT